METVEKELRQLVALYTAEPTRNINPFSMRLQVYLLKGFFNVFFLNSIHIYIFFQNTGNY